MNNIIMNKKVVNIINDNKDINYELNDYEDLELNVFFHSLKDLNINIKQNNNSNFLIKFSSFIKEDVNINIKSIVLGNNNTTNILVRTISENNNGLFNVNVQVNENTIDNIVCEDLKGINENGSITFLPILQIDTNEVNASHFATIGSIDKDMLFYLESKGIDRITASDLLKKSFIYSYYNEEIIKIINKGEDNNE